MTSNQIQQDAENDPQIFRVVVINDNHVQCQMLAGLLRREQLDAQTFLSAEAALESMMRIGAPHLIITDLYMPGIDGWRFCRLLRSPEYALLNQVPILVVSATYSGEETTRITNDLGANAFLLMPVDGEVFIKQVHALLRGEQPQEALHVLIVENSKLTSASLVNKFQEYGYLTDAAFTLQEGITMLGQKTYDIAVLDHHLPDGQGDALLKIAQDKSPGCVCMMMSAETQADLALTWMKNGAGAYLHVPFTPDYLIAQCERARRERALLRVQELLNIRTCQLRESEEKYRNLVNYSSDPIFSFNPDETYHFVNEAFARSFGKNPEDIIGKTPHAIFPYDEAEKRLTLVRHVFKTGEKGEIESKVITHAGDERYYLTLADPIKDVQEKVLYVVCTSKDITTRKRAEESLRESEKRFNLALEGTDAGIWDWDMLNDQVVYSARWKSMLGYTGDEVENSFYGWKNLWHPEDGARIEKAIADYLTGETKHYEIIHRCRHKDGDWRWILTRGATLKDAEGKPYR